MNGRSEWLENVEMVANWLNDELAGSGAAYEPVSRLVEALSGLGPLLREHPVAKAGKNGTTEFLDASPGALLRDAINKSLAKYQFKPTLLTTGEQSVRMKWLSVRESGEATMIAVVCDLYNAAMLSVLGRCEVCKKWIAKAKADRKFCSAPCRFTFYAQTEKGKQYHGAKAKEQYERKRKPTLDKVGRVLREWERKPLGAGVDWKARMVKRVPEVSKAFLTRALKNGEIQAPQVTT